MFVQQQCFQKSIQPMMSLGSGMVSRPKNHYHYPRFPQQYRTIPPDFVRLLSLYGIDISTLRALPWIFSMYFLLSDGGSPRLIKKMEVECAIKPLHPTSIRNTFIIQAFLIYCSRRSSYFSNIR